MFRKFMVLGKLASWFHSSDIFDKQWLSLHNISMKLYIVCEYFILELNLNTLMGIGGVELEDWELNIIQI